jgi:hypothetical protein
MSAATGTIGRVGPRPWVRFYWLSALLLASLVAVSVWAMVGRDAGSAPAPSEPRGVPAERIEDPSGWRHGSGGEMFPRPFAPIQSSSD